MSPYKRPKPKLFWVERSVGQNLTEADVQRSETRNILYAIPAAFGYKSPKPFCYNVLNGLLYC